MSNPLNNSEVLRYLEWIRDQDLDSFMRSVFLILKTHRADAVEESSNLEIKTVAIDTLLEYFEKAQAFEECQFLFELKKEISGKTV